MKLLKFIGVSWFACASFVHAHTPYLAPLSFEENRYQVVTLDAAFAEQFFIPDVAFDQSFFKVVNPDGTTSVPDYLHQFKTRVSIEHRLIEEGTYKFSTGHRLGKVFKVYKLDDEMHLMEDASQDIPQGAELVDWFQSNTLAETYITKGAPTDKALKPSGVGLEMAVSTHPSDAFVDEGVEFSLQFNGKPLTNRSVDVYLAEYQQGSEKPTIEVTTNSKGEFSFTPDQAGVYLLRTRYRAQAPANSPAPEISHTYTLVIEVAE